jgi:uncharacterized protein (DUF302 family)
MRRHLLAAALLIAFTLSAAAAPEGTVVIATGHSYQELVGRLDQAVKANKMGLVTRASATVGAKKVLNKEIPGNMVVGVYHPRFAVPMLEASVAAGIEAPLRFYITENADGSANLSYRQPSAVFAPYEDGGQALQDLAAELDALFAKIAEEASAP